MERRNCKNLHSCCSRWVLLISFYKIFVVEGLSAINYGFIFIEDLSARNLPSLTVLNCGLVLWFLTCWYVEFTLWVILRLLLFFVFWNQCSHIEVPVVSYFHFWWCWSVGEVSYSLKSLKSLGKQSLSSLLMSLFTIWISSINQ